MQSTVIAAPGTAAAAEVWSAWPLASTASAKLKSRRGRPVTSGRTQVLGATRYQPRVVTVPLSSMPSAAITRWRVSLHQTKPAPSGFCAAAMSTSKKSPRPAEVSELVVLQKLNERCVGLGAANAVDGGGVIAGNDEQALDGGVARLFGGVFGPPRRNWR